MTNFLISFLKQLTKLSLTETDNGKRKSSWYLDPGLY